MNGELEKIQEHIPDIAEKIKNQLEIYQDQKMVAVTQAIKDKAFVVQVQHHEGITVNVGMPSCNHWEEIIKQAPENMNVLKYVRSELFKEALRISNGSVRKAEKILNVGANQMWYWLKKQKKLLEKS